MNLGRSRELVCAERIISKLRVGGCGVSGEFGGADLVVVNSCGFLNVVKLEPLDAARIGESVFYNGGADLQPGVIVSTGVEFADDCDLWAVRVLDA